MAQGLRVGTAFAPSTCTGWRAANCNFSSRGSDALFLHSLLKCTHKKKKKKGRKIWWALSFIHFTAINENKCGYNFQNSQGQGPGANSRGLQPQDSLAISIFTVVVAVVQDWDKAEEDDMGKRN